MKLLYSVVLVVVQLLSHVLLFTTPLDRNMPGFPVPRILSTKLLEWVANSSSRGSS